MSRIPAINLTVRMTALPFVKTVSPRVILGDALSYGNNTGGSFNKGTVAPDGSYIAYLPKAMGRGIHIACHDQIIQLSLAEPCTEEEIKAVFDIARRIRKIRPCRVACNGHHIDASEFDQVQEMNEAINLQVLHRLMSNLINESGSRLTLMCIRHPLTLGGDEAELFWSGTDTSAFRNWLNDRQQADIRLAEPAIIKSPMEPDVYRGIYTLATSEDVLFPKRPILPIDLFDFRAGKPKFVIEDWAVRLLDSASGKYCGIMDYDQFISCLPKRKVQYYDAGCILIKGITAEEMNNMMIQSNGEGDRSDDNEA